jgi:hypothetical protein
MCPLLGHPCENTQLRACLKLECLRRPLSPCGLLPCVAFSRGQLFQQGAWNSYSRTAKFQGLGRGSCLVLLKTEPGTSFLLTLLVKASSKASLDQRGGETDSPLRVCTQTRGQLATESPLLPHLPCSCSSLSTLHILHPS